jgi:glycosyltransferase involved in cell wall biosynthesis
MPLTPPRVSVIIPTYNGDRYLPQAIASVFTQTYEHYEVIVVDDGSTDTTPHLLQGMQQQYGDRLQVVQQANQGVAVARNRGVELARGTLIAFLDADDFYLPTKLAAQVAVFDRNPHLGLVHSGWRRVNAEGASLKDVQLWQTLPTLDLETWLRWKPVLPSAMMIRRDWLQQCGGFDARFPPAEDTELVLRLALMGCQAEWLRQVTVCYRQHEASAMHRGLPQARSLAAVIDHFFAQPHLPEPIRWLEQQVRYSTLVWIAWYLYHTGHLTEMADYLQRSLHHTPYSSVATVVHWADSFTAFSQDWDQSFDAHKLGRSPIWQELMRSIN